MITEDVYQSYMHTLYLHHGGLAVNEHALPLPHVSAMLEKRKKATFLFHPGPTTWDSELRSGRVMLHSEPDKALFLGLSTAHTECVLDREQYLYLEGISIAREDYPKFDQLMEMLEEKYYKGYSYKALALKFARYFGQDYSILVHNETQKRYLHGQVSVNWSMGPMFVIVDAWENGVPPGTMEPIHWGLTDEMTVIGAVQSVSVAYDDHSPYKQRTRLNIVPFEPQKVSGMNPFDIEFLDGTPVFKYGKLEPKEKLAYATMMQPSMDQFEMKLAASLKDSLIGKSATKENIDKAGGIIKEALTYIVGEAPGANEVIDAAFDGDEPSAPVTPLKTHVVSGSMKEDGTFSPLTEKDIEVAVTHDQITKIVEEKPNKNYDIVPKYWVISKGLVSAPADKSALKYVFPPEMEALSESKKMQELYKSFSHHFGAAVLSPSSEANILEMMESAGVGENAADAAVYHACLSVMNRNQIMKLFLMAFPEAKSVEALQKMIWLATGDKVFMGVDWSIEFKSESLPGTRLLDVEGEDGEGKVSEEEEEEEDLGDGGLES